MLGEIAGGACKNKNEIKLRTNVYDFRNGGRHPLDVLDRNGLDTVFDVKGKRPTGSCVP